MRYWKLSLLLSLISLGCAALGTAVAPVAARGVELIAVRALESLSQELDEVPHVCTVENHPETGKLLVLCTLCYELQPGDPCD